MLPLASVPRHSFRCRSLIVVVGVSLFLATTRFCLRRQLVVVVGDGVVSLLLSMSSRRSLQNLILY